MKILVTGGAGFQGSHLVESLLKKKHQVSILNTPSEEAFSNIKNFQNKIKVIWGSITDPELVDKANREQDVVFHLAAYINVDESRLHPERVIHTNVIGTTNLLNAVRKYGNRLIYASSCEAYGDGHPDDSQLAEDAEFRPNSPYAASKAAADRICYSYYKSFGTDVTIVRPFNIFGERQKAGKFGALIPILVSKATQKENLTVFGDGKQSRDYMHVDDIIAGYHLVLNHPELKGRAINFGQGRTITILDIASYIAKKFGVKVIQGPARPGEVIKFGANITFAKSLGWKPKVDFWTGLDHYIRWAKNNVK